MTRRFVTFDGELDTTFSADTERRTITGLMVPWNQSARSNGQRWRFRRGGIKWTAVNRVKLLRDHDNGSAIGKCISIDDTDAGLVGTFKVSDSVKGDEALALAVDGVLDGLSIGAEWRETDFTQDPLDPGGWLVNESALRECSLTAMPSFDDSRLTSVRASDRGETMDKCPTCGVALQPGVAHTCTPSAAAPQPAAPAPQPAPEPTPASPQPAPQPAPAPQQQMAGSFSWEQVQQLIGQINGPGFVQPSVGIAPAAPQTPAVVNPTAQPTPAAATGATFVSEALPYRFTYQPRVGVEPGGRHIFHAGQKYDFSTDLFKYIDSNGSDHEAGKRVNALIQAAFDVDTTDGAAALPAKQRPDLWQPQMDYATPLWDMINAGSTDGDPFILPKFNSSGGLVSPATEGVEPAPGTFTITSQTITPTVVWGKVEITRQLIRRGGNPQMSGLIWDQMLREYYEDRESAVATFLNTLTAAADITVTTGPNPNTNAGDLVSVASFEAAIAALQFVRGGNRFRAFAAHVDLYQMFARVTDTAGRKLFPQIGAMNANGTAAPLFTYMDVAGVRVVPSWALGATGTAAANSWLFDPAKVRGWASTPERLDWNFGATVQTANIPQLSEVTMGIYGDIALGNVDINGVRQVIYDPI